MIEFDQNLLLIINGAHSPAFDVIMKLFSAVKIWFPLYGIIALWLSNPNWQSRDSLAYSAKERGVKFWKIALTAIVIVAGTYIISENIASLFKDNIQRFRPSHDPIIGELVRTIDGKGSLYGFFSAHAANCFGFALISSLIIKNRIYTPIIIVWSLIIAYSRMYLGMHYPLDILCGLICGGVIATTMYQLYKLIINRLK
jgi:undecaprenyl-diphosphatase